MSSPPILDELALVAAVAVAVTVLLARLRLPSAAGLLLAGALVGPHGFGLVHSVDAIEALSEVGVVLLLFTIGLELSLARLRAIFRRAALGALLQVALTTGVVAALALAFGETPARSVLYGCVLALSSTAMVLRSLSERGELDAPHGRFIVGTLVLQDLCVVPMVLVIPLLAHPSDPGTAALDVALALGKAGLVVAAALLLARFVVPRVLAWVDASRSREVFLLAILALCIGTAWLTALAGLSLALGAFLGGLVVADTQYGHRAMGDILPLRDAFVSLFFVSLGMLFDPAVLGAEPLRVALFLAGLLLLKGFLAALAALAARFPARVAWLAGVGLSQFGEFGFVLSRIGVEHGVVDDAALAPLLAAGVISLFVTPLLARAAPHVHAGARVLGPLERLLGGRRKGRVDELARDAAPGSSGARRGHVLIVGFGPAGELVAEELHARGEPYRVLELNARTVERARARGLPLYYGDATHPDALTHAGLESARALVLLVNDAPAAKRMLDTAQRLAPHVPVLVRVHHNAEQDAVRARGARAVVADESAGAQAVLGELRTWLEPETEAAAES